MGTKPDTPAYEPGDDCDACKSVIFNEITPKYVEAHVEDITVCPGFVAPTPNGVFLLTQTVPCQWVGFFNGWAYRFQLSVFNTSFAILAGPSIVFTSTILIICQTSFTNQNGPCNLPFSVGTGGTVDVFWGPTIDPGP